MTDPLTCTCPDHEPRPINAWSADPTQYVHSSDDTEAWTIHLHLSKEGRDCDGLMSWEWSERPQSGDPFDDFPVLWARERMLDAVPYSDLPMSITLTNDSMEAGGSTEEGYVHLSARVCERAGCDLNDRLTRDHQAEAAGY